LGAAKEKPDEAMVKKNPLLRGSAARRYDTFNNAVSFREEPHTSLMPGMELLEDGRYGRAPSRPPEKGTCVEPGTHPKSTVVCFQSNGIGHDRDQQP
jgi:hypothetical protein